MKKTIKELADELGVSKQTVQYHFKSLPTSTYMKNDKGVYILKDEAVRVLKGKILVSEPKENDKESTKETDELYSVLVKQLSEKDLQIESLLSGQKQLQKLLDQQQVLTLQANKKIAELETSLSDPDEIEEQTEVESNTGKKSFWSKLFG